MHHVFSAEVLGAAGDYSGAAAEYLAAALASDDPEIAERAAKVAVSANEWQMVALASDRWAMLDPDSLDARELAAGSRLREGDYVGAEYQLSKILELTTDDPAQGWRMVTGLLAPATDRVRSNKVLENLFNDFDGANNVEALFASSQLAAHTGDLEKAAELAEAAIELDSGRSDLLAWSGRLAVNRDDQDLALQRYHMAWSISPDDRTIAMAYAELLKRNDELAAGQDILAQLPDSPDMRFGRIVYALDGGDREGAEILYGGFAGAGYEDATETAFHAAQSAELLGHLEEAVDWYGQVTGERALRAVMRRAFLLAELEDMDQARDLLVQLRKQADPDVVSQSYQAEAQILQNSGKTEDAVQILTEALENSPEDAGLRYSRALTAVGIGQLELAENDLRRVIAAQPENAAALNALGYTLADLTERFEEAEWLIRQAYKLQPEDSSIIDSMGWIAYRQGRLQEAESFLREAWRRLRNAEVAAHLGEVLWAAGQENEARVLWQMGTEIESDNEVLINTLRRFGELP